MAPTDTFPQRREVRHLDCHRQDHLVRERSRWSVLLRHRTSTVLLYLSLSLLFVVSLIHSYNRAQQAEKKNLNEFEGIYVLHDLDLPDAQRILDLEALLGTLACSKHQAPPSPSASTHMPPRFSTLDSRLSAVGEENRFGHADHEFPFCDALWTCSTMFASSYVAVAALLLPHAAHS